MTQRGLPAVTITGDFGSPTGYANDARMLACALIQAGVDVAIDPIPMDCGTAHYGPVAELLRPLIGREFDAARAQVQLLDTVPNFWLTHRREGSYAVARLAWETDTTPDEWVELTRACGIDEIWAPSTFNQEVFARDLGVRCAVVPMAHDLTYFGTVSGGLDLRPQGIDDATFVFLSVGTWIKRKNFEGLLAAYCAEFGPDEPVHLVLKVNSGRVDTAARAQVEAEVADMLLALGPDRRLPPITILQQHLPTADMIGLYRRAQCGVFPSHGEGWGLPVSEMMACGVASIVTEWGGALEFCDDTVASCLPYRLTPVRGMRPMPWYDARQSWAEPDLRTLRERMRWVTHNRAAWQRVGTLAKRRIQQNYSMPAVGASMVQLLRQIGERL